MILVKNLEKYFGSHHALKNINFKINRGDKIAIIGPSGAGKSTLLRCLNLLETPDSGYIFFNNMEITSYKKNINRVRQKMNMVFQYFNLFENKTVLENITLAPIKLKKISKEKAVNKAIDLLDRVGLLNKKNCFPKELSGGQKQRVAILRAMAMDPQVILFDEPTSSLDPEMVGEVLNVMQQLAQSGITMICVTHEINFAKNMANRIIFMCEGTILKDATPEEVFNNPSSERLENFLNSYKSK